MKREDNESFEKYQERRKEDNRLTKLQMKGDIICCKDCKKFNKTLRNVAGEYFCDTCVTKKLHK